MDRTLGYRGRQVLDLVRETIAMHGTPPSYSTIRDSLGFNDRAEVCRVVERLECRGVLYRDGYGRTPRIRLTV